MKTQKAVSLILRSGRARTYVVELVELARDTPRRYLVDVRYGWEGREPEEGTKTPEPVDLVTAERLVESLVRSRRDEGYVDLADRADRVRPASGSASEPASGPSLPATVPDDPRSARLLARLERADALDDEDRAKLVWRVGQVRLAAAAPALVALEPDCGTIASRVLPYALYRCAAGTPAVVRGALEALAARADDAVSEPARVALSCLAEPAGERERLMRALPAALSAALQAPPGEAVVLVGGYLALAIEEAGRSEPSPDANLGRDQQRALLDLFLLSRHAPDVRPLVLEVLRHAPFAPFLFRGLRRVFKAAEAVDDAAVFAVFARRFDEERASHGRGYGYVYVATLGRHVNAAQVRGGDDARIAWSETTRGYLRRRVWRQLRRLGELDDPAYVALASACLVEAEEASEAPDATGRRGRRARGSHDTAHPALANRFALHAILHGAGERLESSERGLTWRFRAGRAHAAVTREEPFAHLWDAAPDALLALLLKARTGLVRAFAARALSDNERFCRVLPIDTIATLLTSDSDAAYTFGLSVARRRLERSADEFGALIPALLAADRDEALELARSSLTLRPSLVTADGARAAASILAVSARSAEWLDAFWARHAPMARLPDLMREIVEQTRARPWSGDRPDPGTDPRPGNAPGSAPGSAPGDASGDVPEDAPGDALRCEKARMLMAADILTKHFRHAVLAVPAEHLVALSHSSAVPPRLLAVSLAACRPDALRLFDPASFATEDDPDLQAAGARLLAEAEPADLAGREALILAFLRSPVQPSREAAVAAAGRLGSRDDNAARTLVEGVLPILYRRETHEGVRDSAIAAARLPALMAALVEEGAIRAWSLLRARAEPARRIGADVLQHLRPGSFTLRETARLGTNDQVLARRWAIDALERRVEELRPAPEQIFALLDGEWEDSREAAYALVRERLDPAEWAPGTVVALCDCITGPAQRFGREMLGRAFTDENASLFLARLAEHPSNGFRLTVARLIREHATGDPARLREVEPALRTILMRVFSSRAAKHQARAFVAEEIDRGDPASLIVLGELLERVSATCATGDRERLLSLIVALKGRAPELVPLATIVEPDVRAGRHGPGRRAGERIDGDRRDDDHGVESRLEKSRPRESHTGESRPGESR